MSKRIRPFSAALVFLLALTCVVIFFFSWKPARAAAGQQNKPAVMQAKAEAPSPGPSTVIAPPGSIVHVVQRGESIPSLLHKYLAPSSYLTRSELEAALRHANGDRKGLNLKPGESLIIPGMEGPIVEQSVPVPKDYEVRAIYLTGLMAGSHNGLELIRRWRAAGGNAVVFDLKDSDGIVNFPFEHKLNPGGPIAVRNLPKFVRFLHQQGMHAIGRIAIFRDEQLVTKHPEVAVQSRRFGQAWRENGKLVWTDPSRPDVQGYNIAMAKQAAQLGVDEFQFDYVRFPAEGDQKDASFAFQAEHPEWTRADVIADFLAKAYAQVHSRDALFSLDVFGVMAWQRPIDLSHTGQDIPNMARYCDVLSPMIYPSHFFGMDGYKVPGDAPEHFISESMDRFKLITKESGVVLRPWLQAFGWRTPTYSPKYIQTQVSVARSTGGIGFLFWNARNDYSKPFAAMPDMRRDPKFFRGDELPAKSAREKGRPPEVASAETARN